MRALVIAGTILAAGLFDAAYAAEDEAALWLDAGEGPRERALSLSTRVDIEVTGMLSRTAVTQRFVNQTDHWAEGRYVFPLPAGAAVDELEIRIGDRRIVGEIRERERARQTYRRAREEGRIAGLVEQESANLFSTNIANIPPGDAIEVRIGYGQPVAYRHGRFRLRFPMTVVPRHGADRPEQARTDAKRDPHGLDSLAVTSSADASARPLELDVTLRPGMPLAEVRAPHHAIDSAQDGGRWRISLAGGIDASDRDFELVWTPRAGEGVRTSVFHEQRLGDEHVLVMLTPPQSFRAMNTPREVIFIIDTSGSMQGQPLLQARGALAFALGSLGPEDRFEVIRFSDDLASLHGSPRAADDDAIVEALRWIEGLRGQGGTVMGPPLERALTSAASDRHLRQVVFVTDGAMGREREILRQVRRQLGASRLFTVGIGQGVNAGFLEELARLGRGTATLIAGTDQIEPRMSELLAQLESPALHDLDVAWPAAAGAAVDMQPERLRDLYVGEPLMFTARIDRLKGDLTVSGTRDGQLWQERVPLEVFESAPGVAALWAKRRIRTLQGPDGPLDDPDRVREAVRETALDYGLLSTETSLVAVDRTPERSRQAALERHRLAAARPSDRGPATGGALAAMPSTDGGTFTALLRGGLALLLVGLMLGYRRFVGAERGGDDA